MVRKRGLTTRVEAGINFGLGNMFDYSGPMLWISQFFHDTGTASDALVEAFDATVNQLRTQPVDAATLDRAQVKLRSALYASLESFAGFGRANLLASFALFDDDPARINGLEAEFAQGHAGGAAGDGARVPPSRQPHDLHRHARRQARGGRPEVNREAPCAS